MLKKTISEGSIINHNGSKFHLRVCLFQLSTFLLLFGCSANIKQVTSDEPPTRFIPDAVVIEQVNIDDSSIKKRLAELQMVKRETYRVSPGDKFNMDVYGEKDLEIKEIIVKSDGTMSLPLIGDINVAELSIPEAVASIESAYRKYIYYPKVTLMPYEMKNSRFTIIGKVVMPGVYYFDGKIRVLDAIAKSKGLATGLFDSNTVELADLEHSFIKRGSELLPVDFAELVHRGGMLMNIPIMDGDYIYIASAVNREYYMLGELSDPGYYGYIEGLTVSKAIAKAKGVLRSASKQLVVIRGSITHPQVYKIDYNRILSGEQRDFQLNASDIVYIPKSNFAKWNDIMIQLMPTFSNLFFAASMFDAPTPEE
ncbi:polysaccharide export outer membrane protein [Sinobacterium caligoides]|uniref:Polysaccharide export outer membrane protein n=1 Tax=Sinobacterium caligoides TaxID=933926 RepID=A0A3N2DPC8_9GAMM|nr:polysaccharide biosynthesis/export family protein [Sinobacterium caligoides]ROS01509.1 polysaccharide export outer membrane protein [Sinobacterium caligoides]